MTTDPDQQEQESIDAARIFVNLIINAVDDLLAPHNLSLSWVQEEVEGGGVQFQFILEDKTPAEDDDLGELDPAAACSVDNPECESCQ